MVGAHRAAGDVVCASVEQQQCRPGDSGVGLKQPDDRADGAVDGAVAPVYPKHVDSAINQQRSHRIVDFAQACRKDRVAGLGQALFKALVGVWESFVVHGRGVGYYPQPYRVHI